MTTWNTARRRLSAGRGERPLGFNEAPSGSRGAVGDTHTCSLPDLHHLLLPAASWGRGWDGGGDISFGLIPEESGAHGLPEARPALPLFPGRGLVAVTHLHGGARKPTQGCLAREPS